MFSIPGESCCSLPGLQFITGGQRGCWYQTLLQWKPPPPSSCDQCGVTVSGQQPEAQGWAFLQNEKRSTCTHNWTSEPFERHMLTCFTAISPTSLFLSTARVSNVSPLSHNNHADCQSELLPQSRGRQQLRLLVSTPHQLPVAPPPCCQKHL